MSNAVLNELVRMSNLIGSPEWDCVILGEGNTSAKNDDGTFYVKGSGCSLGTMGADDFVHLNMDTVLGLLDESEVDEARLKFVYQNAKVNPRQEKRPSVETVFHAAILNYEGVQAVAHTHASAVNMFMCSPKWQPLMEGRICPDEAVVMGRESVFVPYVDPGVILAQHIRNGIDQFRERYACMPKVVYMQNHGVIAIGSSCQEAANITQMVVKMARVRLGCIQAGGIAKLPADTIDHLLGRPDEKYRMQQLGIR